MAHSIGELRSRALAPLIVFTHIPKTAGTSFVATVIAPNVQEDAIIECGGFRSSLVALLKRPQVITGHTMHGLHRFNAMTGRKTTYITFFRDPIDRAVSYYHFVRSSQGGHYKHPLYDYANSVSLAEFYRNRRFQNQQARYIAGSVADRLYNLSASKILEKAILQRAMSNLNRYYRCFGLQERFDESVALFQRIFNWHRTTSVAPQKTTLKRPKVSELDEETLQALRQAHQLDIPFYAFAARRFEMLVAGEMQAANSRKSRVGSLRSDGV